MASLYKDGNVEIPGADLGEAVLALSSYGFKGEVAERLCIYYYRFLAASGDVGGNRGVFDAGGGSAVSQSVPNGTASGIGSCVGCSDAVGDGDVNSSSRPSVGGGMVDGQATTGNVCDSQSDDESPVGVEESKSGVGHSSSVTSSCVARGKNYEKNRARRERRKFAKKVQANVKATACGADVTRGFFSECSQEVRRELRDTRAQMLVSQNKMRALEAEHKSRQTQARLKARVVEEEVEKKRLDLALALDAVRKRHSDKLPVGFAETLVSEGLESVFGTPSLSSGSVSPDSSISVSELRRKDEAIKSLIVKVAALESEKKGRGAARQSTVSSDEASQATEFVTVEDEVCVKAARDVVFGGNLRTVDRELVGGEGYSQWDVPISVGTKPSAVEDAAMLARCKKENSTAELIAPGTVISRF